MRTNSALGFSVSFFALAILSTMIDVSVQILSILSLCSLLFAISQAIDSFVNKRASEYKAMIGAIDKLGNWNLTEVWRFIYEEYSYPYNAGWKDKIILHIAGVVECLAYIVLILGLVMPIPIFENERIGTICTISSFSILFFSFWLSAKSEKNSQLWKDLTLVGMLLQKESPITPITQEEQHEEAENAQP